MLSAMDSRGLARFDDPAADSKHQGGTAGRTALAGYQQIAESIKDDIRAGTLNPGDKLPSNRRVADLHAVSLGTAQKALGLLETEGWVTTTPAVGVFVSETLPAESDEVDLAELADRLDQLADMTGEMMPLIKEILSRVIALEAKIPRQQQLSPSSGYPPIPPAAHGRFVIDEPANFTLPSAGEERS